MRGGSAKASAFFFLVALVPAVTHGLPTRSLSTNAATEEDSVILWQELDGVYAQFKASCASCASNDENVWPVDFFIGGTSGPCDNVTVAVNGQELYHHWDREFSSGSGSIPSSPSNGSAELQATWQSICVSAPLGAPHKQNAYIFTLIKDNEHDRSLEDDIGFTVSFGGYNEIEVLRVSTFPVDLSHGSEWEEWRHSDDEIESGTDSALDYSGLASVAMKLEAELQKLQVLRYELQLLQNSVTLQEKKIRRLLKKDCEPLLTKWHKCDGFLCYLKSSWQKVPEFYWSVRYRFGLLGSGRINPICPSQKQPSHHDPTISPDSPSTIISHPVPTVSNHYTNPHYLSTITSRPVPTISNYNADAKTINTLPIPTLSHHNSDATTINPHPVPTISNYNAEAKTINTLPIPTLSHHNSDATTINPRPVPTITNYNTDINPDASITEVVLPSPSPIKHFLRSCAILLLIALIFGLFFRVIRHSTAFRRRRRDLASRQEELRARRAYRNAARRLRWRQWWERRSYFLTRSVASSHSLAEFEHARGANQNDNVGNRRLSVHDDDDDDVSDSDSYTSSERAGEESDRRLMQNEILGLRRVLEYVGDLVSADVSSSSPSSRRRLRSRSRSRPPPYEDVVTAHARRNSATYRGSGGIHSSTPPPPGMSSASAAGLSSPRASTMFSLETGSRITLETIDTLDSGTAPPSYHTHS
ncbi:hypothetical protein UA08_03013 [Talaromyces atroroseus]|uniref:SUN domain-containing protein n=1 Tax=Talaromyces atroroseus TaxID=1441469 RepID=A0A225AX73_TALAT|nr:hypothetical protein UA08_03013 [Talaromyces atroroseus]OKL61928.1 hypothetical protein UA08_03013 [Talaromyces atroroseus]